MKGKVFVVVLLLCVANIAHAEPTVWYVHPDSALNSIQAGFDSCSADDTVLVGPGTYYENIVWPNVQGLDLISEYGPDTTIIDGGGTSNVIKITTGVDSMTTINGFTLTNGLGYFGGGIECRYCSATIVNNVLTGNTAVWDGGGIYCNSASPSITNNTITNNTVSHHDGGGIACYNNSLASITGNTISYNTAPRDGGGIYCDNSSPVIMNNTIANNTILSYEEEASGGGIACYNNSSAMIMGNTITANTAIYRGGGIHCDNASPTITGNIIASNTAHCLQTQARGGGICCYNNSLPIISVNSITMNSADHDGGGIYCHNSAPTISGNTITDNNANNGNGGGIYCTIYLSYDSFPTITANFITMNTADGGGGVLCDNISPIITDNTITDNIAASHGGGIYCFDNSSPTITGNTITDNTADYDGGGIICRNYSSPMITGNTVTMNTAVVRGGGIHCDNASPTIAGNTITGNEANQTGGGIHCQTYSSPAITDNNITDNTANNGGGIYCFNNSSPTIANNTITGNTASYHGGGINYRYSSPTVTGNTITYNTANQKGGGIYCEHASSLVDSCTISNNSGDGVYCCDSGNPLINHNNITDNTGYGVRNVDSRLIVNANYNWWGDPSGPGGVGPGIGDEVSNWVSYEPYRFHPVGEEEQFICGNVTDQYNGLPIPDVIVDLYSSSGDSLLTLTATDSAGFYEFLGYPIDGDTHYLQESEQYLVWMILPESYCTHDSSSKTAVVSAEVDFTAYVCGGSYARGMGYWKHQVNMVLKGKVHNYTETDLLEFLDTIYDRWDYFDNVLTMEDMKDVFKANSCMADRAAKHLLALELNVVSGKLNEGALIDLGDLSDATTVGEAILECEGILLDSNSTDPDYEQAKDIAEMLNNMEGFVGGGPQFFDTGSLATPFGLSQNYPNPFTSTTSIPYALSKRAHVTLKICNAAGQLVNTLVDQVLESGYHTTEWDRKDRFGHQVPTGIYFYRLSADGFISVKKMTIVR